MVSIAYPAQYSSGMIDNRRIGVFVSSTSCDMVRKREEWMAQDRPEPHRFCRERQAGTADLSPEAIF